jgi:rhodanese-related sulfurtransferase
MNAVIIDVRSHKEFREEALDNAINIPSDAYKMEDYLPYKSSHICLICESGARARTVQAQLKTRGFDHVSVMDKHMADIRKGYRYSSSWSIDRQFRLALAIFLGIFLMGYFGNISALVILPIIVFSGLLYSAVTDNCYLKELIVRLPWNKV